MGIFISTLTKALIKKGLLRQCNVLEIDINSPYLFQPGLFYQYRLSIC